MYSIPYTAPVRALTCADIKTLGKNVASLLPSQIGSIGNADFSDCAESLGQVSTWNKDQLAQLGGKAKQVRIRMGHCYYFDSLKVELKQYGFTVDGRNGTYKRRGVLAMIMYSIHNDFIYFWISCHIM